MAATIDIFTLFKAQTTIDETLYLMLKAKRPSAPNWDTTQTQKAIRTHTANLHTLLDHYAHQLSIVAYEKIGEWQDGLPEGDVWYGDATMIPVNIWCAWSENYPTWCVFGDVETERAFWQFVDDAQEAEDFSLEPHLQKPAKQLNVIFIQKPAPMKLQPIRAHLQPHEFPCERSKFPCNLVIYNFKDGKLHGTLEKIWYPVNATYRAFLQTWDKFHCPECGERLKKKRESIYIPDKDADHMALSSRDTYKYYMVYTCEQCQLGWTQYQETRTYVDVSYP